MSITPKLARGNQVKIVSASEIVLPSLILSIDFDYLLDIVTGDVESQAHNQAWALTAPSPSPLLPMPVKISTIYEALERHYFLNPQSLEMFKTYQTCTFGRPFRQG